MSDKGDDDDVSIYGIQLTLHSTDARLLSVASPLLLSCTSSIHTPTTQQAQESQLFLS